MPESYILVKPGILEREEYLYLSVISSYLWSFMNLDVPATSFVSRVE